MRAMEFRRRQARRRSRMLFLLFFANPAFCLDLESSDVFIPSATKGVRINGYAFYPRTSGAEMVAIHAEQSESDKADIAYYRLSEDNGRTWSAPTPIATNWETETGTVRRYSHPGFVDPDRDILLTFYNQGVLPTDDPLEGMKHWTLRYSLSRDGGRTTYHELQVIHRGEEFSADQPFPGVRTGKNCTMLGDHASYPIRLKTGEILQPIQITPLGPDGEYYNPGGGYTYHDSAVLIGTWNERETLDWELSERVVADPSRSTRGMLEPTLAELPGGAILMVMRGSNQTRPEVPSYRWFSISANRGRTWTSPEPWTYSNGETFFSPSSCSQLLQHTNGSIYWIGNISASNPDGNLPRYPLVICEVDIRTMKPIKETVCVIDNKREDDWVRLSLSNFFAHEDRDTSEIIVYLAPLFRNPPAEGQEGLDWTADLLRYRIRVGPTP